MVIIDLSKSHFFLRDLATVQTDLSALNSVDAEIKKLSGAITSFLNNPKQANSEEVKSVLYIAKEIAQTYGQEAGKITELLDKLNEEIEYLELSQTLTAHASLISIVNHFHKLCTGK